MKPKFLIFLTILASIFYQCTVSEPETSEWRGPERTGFYPETGLLTEWPDNGPTLLWRYDDLGSGYTTVAVTSKKVYTTGTIDSSAYIFALDLDGNLLWKKPFGKSWRTPFPGVRTTPVIRDGLGYVVSDYGKMVCFSTENGDIIWEKDWVKEYNAVTPYYGFCENLLVDGDVVYCTPGDTIENNVLALNLH